MEFSFLHIADIHLSRQFSGLSEYLFDENTNDILKNALIKNINNIIDIAVSKNVDCILIAGDTFDSEEQDFSSKLFLKRTLQKLEEKNISVFLVCGNHDPIYSYNKTTFNFDENSCIKIIGLNTPNFAQLPLRNKNGEIVGTIHALSFQETKFSENPVKYFTCAHTGFNIGLMHCDLNTNISNYAPCLKTELKDLNYDYFALGHIHIPSSEDNIQYSGTIQGRNSKETGAHGIKYIKVIDNKIIENKFIPTDIVRYEDITINTADINDTTELYDNIQKNISDIAFNQFNPAEMYFIRVVITGYSEFFNELNDKLFNEIKENIKLDFDNKVIISQIICEAQPNVDSNLLKEDKGISGEIYRLVENETIIRNSFESIENEISNIISECNFSDEEYIDFRENLISAVQRECKNISAIIYENSEVSK